MLTYYKLSITEILNSFRFQLQSPCFTTMFNKRTYQATGIVQHSMPDRETQETPGRVSDLPNLCST